MSSLELKETILRILFEGFKARKSAKYVINDHFSGLFPDIEVEEIRRAIEDLAKKGYLKDYRVPFSEREAVYTSDLNYKGYKYIGQKLLQSQNGEVPSEAADHGGVEKAQREYRPQDYYLIRGDDLLPCFQVEKLAKGVASFIDSVSLDKHKNISLLGLFAPWGRGKSHFMYALSRYLLARECFEDTYEKRSDGENKKRKGKKLPKKTLSPKYDIINFNAWKYQETPAIWAYLFESLFQSKSKAFRFWHSVRRNYLLIIRDLVLFSIPIIIAYLLSPDNGWRISAWLLSSAGFFVRVAMKEYDAVLSIIKKYTKGTSFREYLGVRSIIEDELRRLVIHWIPENKVDQEKILLFVDDIDRCDAKTLLDVIESLRLIMEQEDIRKRMVVVCSVDPSVLYTAMKVKYETIYKDRDIDRMIKDQFDKLFIATIALPDISIEDAEEYLDALCDKFGDDFLRDQSLFQKTVSLVTTQVFNPLPEDKNPSREELETELLSEEVICKQIDESLKKRHLSLTPRQINRVYHRSVLAAYLIGAHNQEQLVDQSMVDGILNRSYGTEIGDNKYDDIIDMVVPFPKTMKRA